jgi:hypothetical protein
MKKFIRYRLNILIETRRNIIHAWDNGRDRAAKDTNDVE